MKFEDFVIGKEFYTHTSKWLCIDKGTRTVVAQKRPGHFADEKWDEGPGHVFFSYDFSGCKKDPFPEKPHKTEFELSELQEFREKSRGYLTCDMVDWAVKLIGNNGPNADTVKSFLCETFVNASPMWRQSHWDLHEKFGW